MTFSEHIAARGLDEKKAIRNLRRRAKYHQSLDRPKFFACAKVIDLYVGCWRYGECYTPDVASRDLSVLKYPTDTAAYVIAWCRLNRLKEA